MEWDPELLYICSVITFRGIALFGSKTDPCCSWEPQTASAQLHCPLLVAFIAALSDFHHGNYHSTLASAGSEAQNSASSWAASILNCVHLVLMCKSINALFQLKMFRTGAVASCPALGVLQRNQRRSYRCCVLRALCAGSLAWLGVGSCAQSLLCPFCVGSILWCGALFSTESVLLWLLALRLCWECSGCGFSLGQSLSSIPCCHSLFLSVSQFFTA